MTGDDALIESEDRYRLPFRHRRVMQIRVDEALTIVLEGDASVSVEQPASLSLGPVEAPDAKVQQLVPAAQESGSARDLFGTTVLSAIVFKEGRLRLVFDSGHHLNVPSSDDYEAWTAQGPGSILVVSLPGGGLAVWA